MNPYAGVLLLVPDDAGSSSLGKEHDAIVIGDRNTKDGLNEIEDGLGRVDQFDASQIDVLRRATRIERGKQNTALEDEAVAQVAGSQPGEKSFKDVELQQFLGGPPCPLCLILEVEVGVPGWRSP